MKLTIIFPGAQGVRGLDVLRDGIGRDFPFIVRYLLKREKLGDKTS